MPVSTKRNAHGIKLTKAQALRLLDWHGGQGSAVYSLGSSSYGSHYVTVAVARKAVAELTADLNKKPIKGFWAGWTTREKTSLKQRITDIKRALLRR